MTDVAIISLRRDKAVAEALVSQLEAHGIRCRADRPEEAMRLRHTKRRGAFIERPSVLDEARVVLIVWSRPAMRDKDMIEAARLSVVDGARLVQARLTDDGDLPFPRAPTFLIQNWDKADSQHPEVAALIATAKDVLEPAPQTRHEHASPKKRIVIMCDGTWQSIYNKKRTNVAMAAKAVQRVGSDGCVQITFYDDGVGAIATGIGRYKSGLFGEGLDDRILEAYRFLTMNYEPGDDIFLFGFSRGAYTVRSLAGLLRTCGVLRREYAHRTREAMELYRRPKDWGGGADSEDARAFRLNYARTWVDDGAKAFEQTPSMPRNALSVRYIGVWDTVGSLGVPNGKGDPRFRFHDTSLGLWVRDARHALAIDERRIPFSPTRWNNSRMWAETAHLREKRTRGAQLEAADAPSAPQHPTALELWFPGTHGGVGGGDETEALSNSALRWVLEGARDAGLAMKGAILDEFAMAEEPIRAPIHRSLFARVKQSLPFYTRWRGIPDGPASLEELSEEAIARWRQNPRWRPRSLHALRAELDGG